MPLLTVMVAVLGSVLAFVFGSATTVTFLLSDPLDGLTVIHEASFVTVHLKLELTSKLSSAPEYVKSMEFFVTSRTD